MKCWAILLHNHSHFRSFHVDEGIAEVGNKKPQKNALKFLQCSNKTTKIITQWHFSLPWEFIEKILIFLPTFSSTKLVPWDSIKSYLSTVCFNNIIRYERYSKMQQVILQQTLVASVWKIYWNSKQEISK